MQQNSNSPLFFQIFERYNFKLSFLAKKAQFYKLLLLTGLVQLGLVYASFRFYQKTGTFTLDGELFYNENKAITFFAEIVKHNISEFRVVAFCDLLFILMYFLFLSSLMHLTFNHLKITYKVKIYAILTPLLLSCVDLCETSIFLIQSFFIDTQFDHFYKLMTIATPFKWASFLIVFFTLLFGIAKGLSEHIKSPR